MAKIDTATVGGITYDLCDKEAVKSVNGSKPDENGNVTVDIPSITVDSAPTSGSANPVSSGGVYTALATKGEVKTVNGTSPDSSGNVQIEVGSDTVPASKVTAGTLGGAVAANASGQDAGTMLLRNCKLMDATAYDAVTDWSTVLKEGEIAWRCE